jgi:hypothetical protein
MDAGEDKRMSTPVTLETIIAAVAPRIDPALVCRDNLNDILTLAHFLPRWRCTGFECSLANPAPLADFGVHLARQDGLLTETGVVGGAVPGEAASIEVWRRLHRFADVWADTQSLVSQAIPAISLEFDVHRTSATVAAPSIFFSIHPGPCGPEAPARKKAVDTCSGVVQALLEVLAVDVSDGVQKKLGECFKALLPKVSFLQFGVWLARPADTFRICAPGLPFIEIQQVVNTLQWQGPPDAYESQWRDFVQFGDKGSMHLDIGEEVSAKLGIEVHFDENSACLQGDDPKSTRFFNYLVKNNWCLPEKRDAVLSWVGGFRLSSRGTALGTEMERIFLRTISHVKIVFQPDQTPEAKVYLGIGGIHDHADH